VTANLPPLDPVINTSTRLSIVALLAPTEEMEFSAVRDTAGLSDSALSKQASALEAAGYIHIRKGHVGKRPRTWLRLTPAGRQAFQAHAIALRAILARSTNNPGIASSNAPDQ
jgi:DNA-binding MarR family transcriptional regulator